MFNDDIQGTGAVTLGAIVAALKVNHGGPLKDQRIVIYGAGSAGMGVADAIREGIEVEDGLSSAEASKRFWAVDRNGLLIESMIPTLRGNQVPYARPDQEIKEWTLENPELPNTAQLLDVVRNVKPTILIGTSTATGAFTEEIIREMAKHVERPIIMPLSNPTSLCEVDPRESASAA
jgi:malate dehydrogenase (oxaloacetate-decarboxylating)